jgi:signal transduction histidine kinase
MAGGPVAPLNHLLIPTASRVPCRQEVGDSRLMLANAPPTVYHRGVTTHSDRDVSAVPTVDVPLQESALVTRSRTPTWGPGASAAAELSDILESMPDAFCWYGRDWRLKRINASARAAFLSAGYDPDLILENPIWDVIPDLAASELAPHLRSAMDERVPAVVEAPGWRRGQWIETRVYPTRDGIVVCAHDVTMRRAAAERMAVIADANDVLASTLDLREGLVRLADVIVPRLASGCAIDLLDDDGALERIVARDEDPDREDSLRRLREMEPFDTVPEHPVHAVLRTGTPWLFREVTEADILTGTHLREHIEEVRLHAWRTAMFVPLMARGRIVGALALGGGPERTPFGDDDLTAAIVLGRRAALAIENARLFADAESARQQAEEANRAKSEFLATMSHELRTPLTAIRGFAELLTDEIVGPINETQRDQLLRIDAASSHLVSLVDDILRYSRLAAGGEEVRPTRFSIRDACEAAADLVRPAAARKSLDLRCRVDGPDEIVETDLGKTKQILVNLLANAVKFTECGHVELAAAVLAGRATFVVSDTGGGIATSQLESIFDPFRQVDQSITRRAGGSGLGLTIARRLARLLGGDIHVASHLGEGSMFTVDIPRRYGSMPASTPTGSREAARV